MRHIYVLLQSAGDEITFMSIHSCSPLFIPNPFQTFEGCYVVKTSLND